MTDGKWIRVDYTNYAIEVFIESRDLPESPSEGLEWKGYQTMAKELLDSVETYPREYVRFIPKEDPGDIEAGRFGQTSVESKIYDLVQKADDIAKEVHKDQTYNGEPYISHPRRVKNLLVERYGHLFTDEERKYVAAAALLHDTIEDSEMNYRDLNRLVGGQVASIVYAVTNEHGLMPYHRIRNNPLAIAVKLGDRIDNLENCFPFKEEKARYLRKYLSAHERFQHELKFNAALTKIELDLIWTDYEALIDKARNVLDKIAH